MSLFKQITFQIYLYFLRMIEKSYKQLFKLSGLSVIISNNLLSELYNQNINLVVMHTKSIFLYYLYFYYYRHLVCIIVNQISFNCSFYKTSLYSYDEFSTLLDLILYPDTSREEGLLFYWDKYVF